MAGHYLTMEQVEDLMLDAVRQILNIPDDNTIVRLAFGAGSTTGSAPAHDISQTVCYIAVNPTDDGYGQLHNISYENSELDSGLLTEVDEYTEEYAVIFSCYGQDAYEWTRNIRNGMYRSNVVNMLKAVQFYPKPGIPSLIQTHELISTAWVRRCDVTVTFYTYARVERGNAANRIEKVNVSIELGNKSLNYEEE